MPDFEPTSDVHSGGVSMYLRNTGPLVALALATFALLLLGLAPLGTYLEWWRYGFGLYRLMPMSGGIATAAVMLSIVTLGVGRSQLRRPKLAMLVLALALGVALAYLPAHYALRRTHLPAIHDISTDTDNPPTFSAVLVARAAEAANSVDERSPELAALQKAAYPDLRPLIPAVPVGQAFQRALDVAREMPGWTIVASDAGSGRIEASQQSRWFRFTDDIVIRVAASDGGSRIDVRSVSRHGRSDYGVNAARIAAFLDRLRFRLR
ncbi:MAG TPA: DUF1499 domain-containing protein [Hyphomicrobiaceae bacterium]|nr:DUF1499 domain-containing protein [Hyphomicrobiaceae bacterium]